MKIHLGEKLTDPLPGKGVVAGLQGQKGEGAVHGAGVHVDKAEILGDEAGNGAFAGGGGTVDADDRMEHGQRPISCSRAICLAKPG